MYYLSLPLCNLFMIALTRVLYLFSSFWSWIYLDNESAQFSLRMLLDVKLFPTFMLLTHTNLWNFRNNLFIKSIWLDAEYDVDVMGGLHFFNPFFFI